MRRVLVVILLALTLLLAVYFFNSYWTHRFDPLINRQASIYRVDPDLVWSIIYEETYFSPWKIGKDGEIGLMQVTPTVGREWAAETGIRDFQNQMQADPQNFLKDPERNIQIGCWYLEKISAQFRDVPEAETRMVAAYNAGPSRAVEWSRSDPPGNTQSGAEFINRIDIPSTRAYVLSIMQRYRQLKSAKNFKRRASGDISRQMTTIYSARWVVPVSAAPIENGAVAVEGQRIAGVGPRAEIVERFPEFKVELLGDAIIIPGLVNIHTHLELTAMRGYLEKEEPDFFAWLRKLTVARLKLITPDDIRVSATWGACEAVRAGITCVGDASDAGMMSMMALRDVGLRGVVYQESFGPDARLAQENFEKLKTKVHELRTIESDLLRAGVSPHAPYTVCGPQLELIAEFASTEGLPLMMHAAESAAEDQFLREGFGPFAEGLARRAIEWKAPGVSTIQYLKQLGVLDVEPLLAHCIRVDDRDIETLHDTGTKVAHCPKSNAKLGHGRAPFARFLEAGIAIGLGSDSVASNNTCDILEEARFATLMARAAGGFVPGADALRVATFGRGLSEGALADLAVVSLTGVHQLPSYDPIATLIFTSSGRDVVLTVVAGREVYRNGRVSNVDEDRLRARMLEINHRLNGS